MWTTEPDYVTFIIPTLGRPSLEQTVQSLLDLESWNWKAIIIFDGTEPTKLNCIDYENDNHFKVLKVDKKYNAGLVRNYGLPIVDTKWTAFVDDDDFLKETYIERLMVYERKHPNADIIIFTYKDIETGNTQPPKRVKGLIRCNVGISFAIKTEFVQKYNIKFPPGGIEDFEFLSECVNKGAKYVLTHDIQYFVGHRSAWT